MKFRSFYRIFFYKKQNWRIWLTYLAFHIVIWGANTAVAESDIVNIDDIRAKVVQFLTHEYQQPETVNVEIKVGGLDPRLRLPQCTKELSLQALDPLNMGGNVNVQVSCKGLAQWTILVPAQANVFRSMAVANRNLNRGDIVSEADIGIDVRDVSTYRLGFSLTKELIVGKEIKYPVSKGEAFRSSALDAAIAIKRGEEVSIEAVSGGIKVISKATATSDGRIGQQIRVKNNQSQRIINARVIGPGKVQSLM